MAKASIRYALLTLFLGIFIIGTCFAEQNNPKSVQNGELKPDVGTDKRTDEGSERNRENIENKDAKLSPDDESNESSTVEENFVKEDESKVQDDETDSSPEGKEQSSKDSEEDSETYGEGSVCVYCQYCKFCKLCDKDCPCKTSKKKPNCHMCKYCKYCNLCSSVCENFCKPGSFLDTISSAFWSALPKFDNKMKGEVEKDIESVKDWIKSYL